MPTNYLYALLPVGFLLVLTAQSDYQAGTFSYGYYGAAVVLLAMIFWAYQRVKRFDRYVVFPLVLDTDTLVEIAAAFAGIHPCVAFRPEAGTSSYYARGGNELLLYPLGPYGAHYELRLKADPDAVRILCRSAPNQGAWYPMQRGRFLATVYALLAARARGLEPQTVGEKLKHQETDADMNAGFWQSGRAGRYGLTLLIYLPLAAMGVSMMSADTPWLGLALVGISTAFLLLYIRSELQAAARRRAHRQQ